MISKVIFEKGSHKWVYLGRDKNKPEEVIDTNQFVVIDKDQGMLLDPGGIEIFPNVLTEITKHISTENIIGLIASHQDPDIASSLALWLDLCDGLSIYCPWIWTGFLAHFGMGTRLKLQAVKDEGMEITVGASKLILVPAHYCHSSGNFSVYDPEAGILFSGDIGAALLPPGQDDIFVSDFQKHIQYMEGFHRRWMPSSQALRAWANRVRALDPTMITPQHGSLFQGENVSKFLDWIENIEVGKWYESSDKK